MVPYDEVRTAVDDPVGHASRIVVRHTGSGLRECHVLLAPVDRNNNDVAGAMLGGDLTAS
jgi:hypothetical protein